MYSPTSTQPFRKFLAAALASSFLALTGCLTMPEETSPEDYARVTLHIPAASAKEGAKATRLHVTMVSSSGDTLRDVITESGSLLSESETRLNPPSTEAQYIHPRYAVDARWDWTFTLETRDARDSVAHRAFATAPALSPRERRNLDVRLAPRYASYDVATSLPASLAGEGTRMNRLELSVDGVPVCDTGSLNTVETVVLTCDHLPPGNHRVTLRVFGRLQGEAAPRLLFEGGKEVNITVTAPVETLTLKWVADGQVLGRAVASDAPGHESSSPGMTVRLGRTGKVVLNVVISGEVVL